MVDRAGYSTNDTFLFETIHFPVPARALNPGEIASLYVDKCLSTAQIAAQLGCSKAFVIVTLKRRGLLRANGPAQTNPSNYRCALPPYGFRVVAGKLTPYPAELRVCRLIVELIDRQGFNFLKTAQHLTHKGIKNRRGTHVWHHYSVSVIYHRWKGKL